MVRKMATSTNLKNLAAGRATVHPSGAVTRHPTIGTLELEFSEENEVVIKWVGPADAKSNVEIPLSAGHRFSVSDDNILISINVRMKERYFFWFEAKDKQEADEFCLIVNGFVPLRSLENMNIPNNSKVGKRASNAMQAEGSVSSFDKTSGVGVEQKTAHETKAPKERSNAVSGYSENDKKALQKALDDNLPDDDFSLEDTVNAAEGHGSLETLSDGSICRFFSMLTDERIARVLARREAEQDQKIDDNMDE